ncbi:hypothetical protein B0T26DRAFT_715233 [Lasiosphaeria miniovina]|uniref:CFEM domain-containing protein n=1 Tax=Lasiosphaeria miniovina TaxID=1954250 RepID=A0AA40AB99_9PEZI|nr:uncharacterized protein B0T26DRAFT_715233 [Lasiosphaeria miniovina]KAK0712770.1 hypothetical protein B0T26DRAFT_715233 [Lasiosphaeria miniovina]
MRPTRRAAFAALALSSCRLAASQWPSLPTCAESCVVSSITSTNCDTVATGDACLCTSNAFVVGVACCAKAACSSADLAATVEFFSSFCASEGIALPATLVCDGVAVTTPSATPPLSPSPSTPISSSQQQQQPSQSTADAPSPPSSPSPSASAAGTPPLSSSVTLQSSTTLPSSQTTPATTKTILQTILSTPTTPVEQAGSGSGDDSGGGLSTGAKAGIGAGAAVGGLAVFAAVAAFLVMQKRKRAGAAAAGGGRAELAADGQQPQEWFEKDGVEAQQGHEATAKEWKADQGGLNGLALLEPHEMPLAQRAQAHELP